MLKHYLLVIICMIFNFLSLGFITANKLITEINIKFNTFFGSLSVIMKTLKYLRPRLDFRFPLKKGP